jgi:phage head maturation protease
MQHELRTRALGFTPSSVNEVERSVELVASTGAGVTRYDFEGPFLEVLSMEPGACDLSRIDGMPLLDSHMQDGLDRVLGVVRAARLEGGQLIVRVQISERHDAIWKDIKDGILRNVSVGYESREYRDTVDRTTGQRTRLITLWTLMETSLVPVAADAGAKTRNTPLTTPNPQPQPSPAPQPPLQTRAMINTEIRALGSTFEVQADVINGLIDREATVEEARSAVLETIAAQRSRPAPAPRITLTGDNESPDVFTQRAGEALYCRAYPGEAPSEQARPFMGNTMVDMARESLRLRSISTTGLSPADIVKRALHTTSDFPNLLGNAANRSVRSLYEAAPAVMKRLARPTTAADFKTKTKIQLGEAPSLEKVNQKGEFKRGSIAEAAEAYKIDTFGKIIGLSRQAIVNDDLGAFTMLARIIGGGAVEFEDQFLVDLLVSGSGNGPTMSDTKALFHSDHGNKAASGAVLDVGALSNARLALRKQKGLSGKPINTAPKFLLVPPELETVAEQLLTEIQPTKAGDVNVFGGKLNLAVEARLGSATRWYVSGDPNQIEGLEYCYLQGEEGPQIDTRAGFDVDGLEIKCRLDFGAAFMDWRGWYMNPGA